MFSGDVGKLTYVGYHFSFFPGKQFQDAFALETSGSE